MLHAHGRPPFLTGLGGVRALAVLAVLVGHAASWLTPLPGHPALREPLARLTQCGLSGFFVLSGFVLQYNYGARPITGPRGLARFAVARLARIYPVYLLLLAVSLAGIFIRFGRPWEVPGFCQSVLSALTLTQSWYFVAEAPSVYPLAWAVSTEIFFYLFFPLLSRGLSALPGRRAAWCAGLAALGAAVGLDACISAHWPALFAWALRAHPALAGDQARLAGLLFEWLTYTSPYLRIFEFIAGMAAARLFVLGLRPPAWLAVAATALLAVLLCVPVSGDRFFFAILKNNALYAPALAALCLSLAANPPAWATHRLTSRIAGASLSIYLAQPFVLEPWKYLFAPTGPLWPMAALAGMAATIAAGMLLARFVEAPAARWINKKRARGETL
ncbi:acyltransferase 3 [Solidesulfovibrio fructosivorans JJ]]|uniref:Acyltransferase 3 n=1 Tax=Solidesulfovibrio fructosivorans JJ] TaxID=596151 RepID=E1JV71_SOLFR|nr:acyltransferase [Solidesulfovibrio fructosivorans]EFL51665.1 acyltransferase 3 [Solidesulfovibrio fructosivorans JJ]]